jgi:hypothetical protein
MPALSNYYRTGAASSAATVANEFTDSMSEFLKVEDLSGHGKDTNNDAELFRCAQDFQSKSLYGIIIIIIIIISVCY